MENVQTCLNFLEYYNVSVNDITAEGKKNSIFPIFQNALSICSFYVSGLGICEFTFGNWQLRHHLRVIEYKKSISFMVQSVLGREIMVDDHWISICNFCPVFSYLF